MSYEKHTWETGETITAEKLNRIENALEGGSEALICNMITEDNENYTSDKTFGEIRVAYTNNIPVFFKFYSEHNDSNSKEVTESKYSISGIEIFTSRYTENSETSYSGTYKIIFGPNYTMDYQITERTEPVTIESFDSLYPEFIL